jgi:hypothetical protein
VRAISSRAARRRAGRPGRRRGRAPAASARRAVFPRS